MPSAQASSVYHSDVSAVVLAGGRATRMGGVDKGLVEVGGKTMVEHVVHALRPQVAKIFINANRNQQRYQALSGHTVVADSIADFAGPLAGMASVMQRTETPWLVSAPCDSPLVTADLVSRLLDAAQTQRARIAVAHDGERLQPVFALLQVSLLDSMLAYLHAGERKIDMWFAKHEMVPVDFSDAQQTFVNVNTPAQRDSVETALAARDLATTKTR